jgi:hypothetical protein
MLKFTFRIVCWFSDHVPVKVTVEWKTWKGGISRKKFKQRRKSWIECDRCGKVLGK